MIENGNPTAQYEATMMQRAGLLYKNKQINPYERDEHTAQGILQQHIKMSYEKRAGWDATMDKAQANRKEYENPVQLMYEMNPTDPMLHPELARVDIRPNYIVRDPQFTSYQRAMAPTIRQRP